MAVAGLPAGWQNVQLGDAAAKVGSGITPTGGERVYGHEGRPFVRSQNVGWGTLDLSEIAYIDEATHQSFPGTELFVDDVLLNITGASIGRSALVDRRIAGGNVNQHVCIIRVDPRRLDARFLNHFLLSASGQAQVDGFQAGGNRQGLNFAQIRSFAVPAPEVTEQCAIAAALSDVDALLAKLGQLIAKKRDLKQAAMQQLLTGQTRLPGFSGEWEERRLGDLFAFYGGHSAARDQLSTVGHCYLHYGDIHKASKAFIDVTAEYQDIPKLDVPLKRVADGALLDDGDVVFVDASEDDDGTSKHMVVVNKDKTPYIAGLHTIVAKDKTQELAYEYRRHCFQSAAIRQQFLFYAVGTKVSGINKSNIVKLTLPVPPLAEQTAIATILSDIDAELTALAARRDKTRALKQGMMQELLTGRIRLV